MKYKISIIGGIIFLIIRMLEHIILVSLDLDYSVLSYTLSLITGITINYYSVKLFKKKNNGYSSFSQTFLIVFLIWFTDYFITLIINPPLFPYENFRDSLGESYENIGPIIALLLTVMYLFFAILLLAGFCALVSLVLKSPKDKSTNIDSSL